MVSIEALPAVIVELVTALNPYARTVSSSVQISGGNLLVLTEPNTVASSVAGTAGAAFGGIAAFEKSILDGDVSTSLSAHMDGKFDIKCAGTCATGIQVVMSGANLVRAAVAAELLTGAIVGTMEEDGAIDEVATVRLRGA